MMTTAGVAIALFAATNVDDIFVLLVFFADPKFSARQVIVGQYIGIIVLTAASIVASLVSLVLAPAYVGLLGLFPILIGLRKLHDLWKRAEDNEMDAPRAGSGNVVALATITVANGGDNIGIYTPVFATSSTTQIGIFVTAFMAMVAVWLAFSFWLVNHPSLGSPFRLYGHLIVPFVLIVIGVWVLYEAGSLSLLG